MKYLFMFMMLTTMFSSFAFAAGEGQQDETICEATLESNTRSGDVKIVSEPTQLPTKAGSVSY